MIYRSGVVKRQSAKKVKTCGIQRPYKNTNLPCKLIFSILSVNPEILSPNSDP